MGHATCTVLVYLGGELWETEDILIGHAQDVMAWALLAHAPWWPCMSLQQLQCEIHLDIAA